MTAVLHYTLRMLSEPKTTPVDFESLARFDQVLAMARRVPKDDSQDQDNQNAYAVGYLAQMVVGLETQLKTAKQGIRP